MKLLVHNLRRCFRRYVCCCCCCCCARAEEESLYANGGSSGGDVLGAGAGSFGKGLAKMRSKRRGRLEKPDEASLWTVSLRGHRGRASRRAGGGGDAETVADDRVSGSNPLPDLRV